MKQKNLRRLRARLINGTWGARFRTPLTPNHEKHNAMSNKEVITAEPKNLSPSAVLDPADLRWRLIARKKEAQHNETQKKSRQKELDDLNRRIEMTKRELETNKVLLTQCQTSLSSKQTVGEVARNRRKVYSKTESASNTITDNEQTADSTNRPKSFVIDQDSGVILFSN